MNGVVQPGEKMRIYDISVPLSESQTPIYPGDTPLSITPTHSLDRGDAYNSTRLVLGTHTGTHFDAPYHFLKEGSRASTIPLETFVGEAWVCEIAHPRFVSEKEMERAQIPQGTRRLLLKTRNSTLWKHKEFQRDFVSITPEAARWMVQRGIKLVGIDYLSAEAYGASPASTHLTLLGAGAVILEGLNLGEVMPGRYFLVFLPLKLVQGGDGAPARAILLEGWNP